MTGAGITWQTAVTGAFTLMMPVVMLTGVSVGIQLLYMTFLAEFFLDDELNMDLLYYSEMKDAGYFEDGSEMY